MRHSINTLKNTLLLCVFFLWNQVSAQTCGKYDFLEAFILDIRHEGESKQARDVEVWLKEMRSNQTVKRILPNEQIRLNGHVEYPRAGNYFLVDFHSTSYLEPEPIYVAMVIYKNDTFQYRLPYESRVHTCSQHLFEKRKEWNDTLRSRNGKAHVPFHITLGQPPGNLPVRFPLEEALAQPVWHRTYDELNRPCDMLQRIRIFDALSLNTVQVIAAGTGFCVGTHEEPQHFRRVDVYGDNPKGIPDLCFTRIKIQRNRPLPDELYRDFWLFSQRHQLWYRSNLLSEYANVELDKEGFPIRAEYEDSSGVTIIRRYQCDGKRWQLASTERRFPPAPPEKPKPRYDYCLTIEGTTYGNKAVQAGTSVQPEDVYVRDTFLIKNLCDRSIKLDCRDANAWMLKIPEAIGPYRTLSLVFEARHPLDPNTLSSHQQIFNLQSSAGQSISLGIQYYLAGLNTVVRDSFGTVKAYKKGYRETFSNLHVLVNHQGIPTGVGECLGLTDRKTGTWQYPDSTGRSRHVELHGKAVAVSIQNQERMDSNAIVEVHREGIWEPAFFQRSNNSFLLATDAKTDSVRISSGGYRASCRYRYLLEQDRAHLPAMLIRPGEYTYYNGICAVPLNVQYHQYVLRWNWNIPETNKEGMLQQQASLIASLRKQFPGLHTDIYELEPMFPLLNMNALSESTRQRLLAKLAGIQEIETISSVVQPNGNQNTFAGRETGVVFDTDVYPERFRKQLDSLGFERMQQTWGTTHYYQTTWKGKLMDASYFRAVSALAAMPGVSRVYPSFHYRVYAEPADRLEE